MHLMRSATFIVGHKPCPLLYATLAAFTASRASASPIEGIEPNIVGAYSSVEEIVEKTAVV